MFTFALRSLIFLFSCSSLRKHRTRVFVIIKKKSRRVFFLLFPDRRAKLRYLLAYSIINVVCLLCFSCLIWYLSWVSKVCALRHVSLTRRIIITAFFFKVKGGLSAALLLWWLFVLKLIFTRARTRLSRFVLVQCTYGTACSQLVLVTFQSTIREKEKLFTVARILKFV